MENGPIRFGDSLAGSENAAFRRQVTDLAAAAGFDRPLVVDSVLALHRRFVADEPAVPPAASPASYLLLDVQHLFLYEETAEGPPRLDSAVRAIVDGYPAQPFDDLDRHFADRPFPSLVPEESLGLLPHLWARRRPGALTSLSLTSGEVATCEVQLHPSSPLANDRAPRQPLPLLEERRVDASLRLRPPGGLEAFVSPAAGVVREQFTIWGFMSLPVATATTVWSRGSRREMCFGKGGSEKPAAAVAVCESLERYQIALHRHGEELVHGTFQELADRNPVDPRGLFFGRSPHCPGDDLLPVYDETLPLYWTPAVSALGEEALVPAQEVWFSVQELPDENPAVAATTSGCALGGCVEEAALFALLEALERDAFLTAWYLRRPCRQIDPDSVADEHFQILRRRWELEFSGYTLHLFDLTNDTGVPAVAAFGVRRHGDGPKAFLGASARISPERACRCALEDIGSFSRHMTETRRRRSLHLLAHPEEIAGPADHGSVYALDETFGRLDFLDFDGGERIAAADLWRGAVIPEAEGYDLREVLQALDRHLAARDVRVWLKDITHPAVAEHGLRCVKAVTPGLLPLWFGSRQRRFGVTPRLCRLAREWGRPEGVYNLEVHPFT